MERPTIIIIIITGINGLRYVFNDDDEVENHFNTF